MTNNDPMSKIKLAINGFGRIGRAAFKVAFDKPELEVMAVNDLAEPDVLAHLLQYDTVYGRYGKKVSPSKEQVHVGSVQSVGKLDIDSRHVLVFSEKEPGALPWRELDIDVVLECTGRFTSSEKARAHITAGAKRVIISAPVKEDGNQVPTMVLGVNEASYGGQAILSNASCTTNSITPVLDVLHKNFGVLKAFMTTVHSYTAEQNLVDGPPPPLHKDLRRSRAAAENIVPTTTGATIAATEAIPELRDKFGGFAIRVPTPCGSLSDFVVLISKTVTAEEINQAFEVATSDPAYKGILAVTHDPIVSSDIVGTTYSSIVDLSLTQVIGGDLVKVVAWYDNEWGYSNRLVEEAILVGKQLQ
jgi:glyceraldehyde 3-phosphate dehydrogenase